MIECRDVTARAGRFVLRDVSFVVPAGGHAVLAGPTGSGKTTLLDAIAGIVHPAHGCVLLGGRDVTRLACEMRAVGVVPQHGYLFPHLTARANVAYGASDGAIVDDMMRRFDILPLSSRAVDSLSGGERQLIALCRALATRPRVMLLDEPFSALDATRRARVAAEFAAMQRESGFTVLHATHHVSEAGVHATQRLEMFHGTVRERPLDAR